MEVSYRYDFKKVTEIAYVFMTYKVIKKVVQAHKKGIFLLKEHSYIYVTICSKILLQKGFHLIACQLRKCAN